MNLVDLCCGAGGRSLVTMAGHTVIAAYDHDADAVATYQRNLGNHAQVADIRDLRGDDLPDCDGIVGGPPCQPDEATLARCDGATTLLRQRRTIEAAHCGCSIVKQRAGHPAN